MKTSQITQRTLIETFICDNDPVTANYLRVMNENFVIPFNKSLLSLNLMEAEMTAQQIQNAFGAAERIATAGGDNRNLLGKGADVAGAAASAAGKGAVALGKGAADLAVKGAKGAKELVNKLLTQKKQEFEQNLPPVDAGPVQNFEQQATQAAEQVEDPKAKKSLMDMVKQGIKNPVAQTMLLTAITGIAGVVAAPAIASLGLGGVAASTAIGAIVGGLSGVVRAKMQGSDWKEAGKQGLKGAGMGAAAGLVGGTVASLGQQAVSAYQNHNSPTRGPSIADQEATGTLPADLNAKDAAAADAGGWTPEDQRMYDRQMYAGQLSRMGMVDRGDGLGPVRATAADTLGTPEYDAIHGTSTATPVGLDANGVPIGTSDLAPAQSAPAEQPSQYPSAGTVRPNLDQWRQETGAPTAPKVTRVTAYDNGDPADPAVMAQIKARQDYLRQNPEELKRIFGDGKSNFEESKQAKRNPYIDYELTSRMWLLHESIGKPHGAVHLTVEGIGDMFKKAGNWLKTKAGNLTNKVTADKLQQAWTKAGSPTDSGQVAAIMAQAGVPQETIDQVFKNIGLPAGSSTPTQAPQQSAQEPKGPSQGILGKAASAIGGAIGGVKGAIAGTKDAFAKGKETGFDTARASQAGDAVGATGEQNPYAKGGQATPPAPGTTASAAPAANTTASAATTQAPAQAQATATAGEPADTEAPETDGVAKAAGEKVAGALGGAAAAWEKGVGMGATGHSVADQSYGQQTGKPASSLRVKDAKGQQHDYKKIGDQWFDKDNQPVSTAQAAMLDQQAKQQPVQGKKATATTPTAKPANPTVTAKAEPVKIGGQTLDPNNPADQKIIAQVQKQQGAKAPASQAPAPAQQTAQQPAQQTAQQPAQQTAQQPAAGGEPATTQPAAQSPEEIRKAKQAAAAKVAQDQMAANPVPTKPTHTGGKVAGQVSQTPNAIRKREQRAAAKAAPNDVMARMAKQLGQQPAAPAGQQMPGYSKVTYNAPVASVPQQPAAQPTTGAKTVPTTAPAPEKFGSRGIAGMDSAPTTAQAPAPAASTPGFLQSKLKGRQPVAAGTDFSAMLARKAKIRL